MIFSRVISTLADLIILAIIISSILSWLTGVVALQPVARFFNRITEPLIEPIRRRLPPLGGIDFSPLIAILLIWAVENILLFVLAGR
jgi:YggT family protein